MKSTSYEVITEPFAERHFIKSFAKKYKRAWDATFSALREEFAQIDLLFPRNIAETILDTEQIKICKTEFKISGTQESRHSSGNRCIVAVHKDVGVVRILLVYSKSDLRDGNETAQWKAMITDNYPAYRELQ